MKLTEVREVTKKERVTIGFKCDCCGKVNSGDELPKGWHEIGAQHEDWGNDSIESIETYTSCSPECYSKLLKEAVDDFSHSRTAIIDGFSVEFAIELSRFLNTKK